MNFYEQQMRQMFSSASIIKEPKFTGKTMLGKLDDELRIKLQLVSTFIGGQYNAVQAAIINRTDGTVDKEIFKFSDIIGMQKRKNLDEIEHIYGSITQGRMVYPHHFCRKSTDSGYATCIYRDVSGGRSVHDTAIKYRNGKCKGVIRENSLCAFYTGGESLCLIGLAI